MRNTKDFVSMQGGPGGSLPEVREKLSQDLEEFKRLPSNLANVVKAATTYRQSLLAVHESGLRLAAEVQKLGKCDTNKYAVELVRRSLDQESIEKDRFTMQSKFWDYWILPLMNSSDSEQRDIQALEKKLKSASQLIDSRAKKEKKDADKMVKKNKENADFVQGKLQVSVQDLMGHHARLVDYFGAYRSNCFSKWLNLCCAAVDVQMEHYGSMHKLLDKSAEGWRSLLGADQRELPNVDAVSLNVDPTVPLSALSSESYFSEGSLKMGYMTKRGEKRKSWKRRWFVLTADTLQYFKKPPTKGEKCLGNILLSQKTSVEENTTMKRPNCFSLTLPGRVYFISCDTKQDMDSWFSFLKAGDATKPVVPVAAPNPAQRENSYYASDPLNSPKPLPIPVKPLTQPLPDPVQFPDLVGGEDLYDSQLPEPVSDDYNY